MELGPLKDLGEHCGGYRDVAPHTRSKPTTLEQDVDSFEIALRIMVWRTGFFLRSSLVVTLAAVYLFVFSFVAFLELDQAVGLVPACLIATTSWLLTTASLLAGVTWLLTTPCPYLECR